ncbi:MAG: hypothetical protein V4726_18630 [Verrucomicrobiota bacterium]
MLISVIGEDKPEIVAAWLGSTAINRNTSPIAKIFTAQWAAADPAAAGAWVKTLPPSGELAVIAAKNVAFQFQRYAPAEAAAWLSTLPAGPAREAAREAMAAH